MIRCSHSNQDLNPAHRFKFKLIKNSFKEENLEVITWVAGVYDFYSCAFEGLSQTNFTSEFSYMLMVF